MSTLLLALSFLSPTVLAEPQDSPSIEEVIEGVEGTYREVETLSADFVQITRSSAAGEEAPQRGKVLLKRPRKMLWEFTGDNQTLFLTDGEQMWIYTPADKQCRVYKDLGATGGTGMESLLDNLDQLDELFTVEFLDTAAERNSRNTILLKLTPLQSDKFKHLRLKISKKKYHLEQVTIIDAFDNETELSFSQMKMNPPADDSRFTFVPPEGVEVISADGL